MSSVHLHIVVYHSRPINNSKPWKHSFHVQWPSRPHQLLLKQPVQTVPHCLVRLRLVLQLESKSVVIVCYCVVGFQLQVCLVPLGHSLNLQRHSHVELNYFCTADVQVAFCWITYVECCVRAFLY